MHVTLKSQWTCYQWAKDEYKKNCDDQESIATNKKANYSEISIWHVEKSAKWTWHEFYFEHTTPFSLKQWTIDSKKNTQQKGRCQI